MNMCLFHHNAYACKWIGHMNGIFHSFHMYIHEQGDALPNSLINSNVSIK
jgi:hypothetical protein